MAGPAWPQRPIEIEIRSSDQIVGRRRLNGWHHTTHEVSIFLTAGAGVTENRKALTRITSHVVRGDRQCRQTTARDIYAYRDHRSWCCRLNCS